MGKLRQLSPELWPLIDVILFSYIELIFRGGVSCLPAALLFHSCELSILKKYLKYFPRDLQILLTNSCMRTRLFT